MGKADTPETPDYVGAAEATALSDRQMLAQQTAANRPDQYNAFGSTTWDKEQVWDEPTQQMVDKWTQTASLDPLSQRAVDSQLLMTADKSDLAQSLTGRMAEEYANPMDWSQFEAWKGAPSVGQQGQLTQGRMYQDPLEQYRERPNNVYSPEEIQRQLDFSGAANRSDVGDLRDQAEQALYDRSTSRLDPQWEQRSADMESKLFAQGLRPGDEAYDRAMENMEMQRQDAYQTAMTESIMGGGAEAQRQFEMQTSARQQDLDSLTEQARFGNEAAQQSLAQQLGIGSQQFQEALADNQQQMARRESEFKERMATQGYNDAAIQKEWAAQEAVYNRQFSQELQAAQLQNQIRQAQAAEAMQQRSQTLNEMNAIMSGEQVSMPTFAGFNQAGRAAATDYSGATRDTFSAEMDKFSAEQAQTDALMSGITSVAGMAMMSDRRLKRNITRAGSFKGYPWYLFQYVWGQWSAGVMADEINKDAVIMTPSGYAAVDYGRIK